MRPYLATCFLFAATLLSVGACDKGDGGGGTEPPADGGQTDTPPPSSGLTGILDEEAFKALHQLTGEAAPELHGEEITLAGTKAYLSIPKDATAPMPAVIVIHEWWGLNDHVKHWADRLAADGYVTLAVDLYGGQVAADPDAAMTLMKAVDENTAHAILSAAKAYLAGDPRFAVEKQAVIGWCFGGAWSQRVAMTDPDLDAAVIYYGHPINDPAALAKINAPMLGVFANQDESIPPAAVDEFAKAVETAGKSIEIHRYDAVHAFANPSNAKYDQTSAADAWNHVRAFLAKHLKGEATAG
jgi:carboxymethylenebutenolidase